jgi:hypothetical protein
MTDLEAVITAAEDALAEAKAFASGEPNAMGGTIPSDLHAMALWQACGLFEVFLVALKDAQRRERLN